MIINFRINGVSYPVDPETMPADMTLNTFIREHAQLTATKNMCLEGGCGVCIVAIKGKHPVTGEMRIWQANSCLTLLNTCADWEIITAEGIGNKKDGYHPIQIRLAKMNGTQCGYCSCGVVMNTYALLESKGGKVSMGEIEDSFAGNICRCTGYRPILDAMKSFATDSNIEVPQDCPDIEDLSTKTCPKTGELCAGSCDKPLPAHVSSSDGKQWHWPKDLKTLFKAVNKVGNAVSGNICRCTGNIEMPHDCPDIDDLSTKAFSKMPLPVHLSYLDGKQWYFPKDMKTIFDALSKVGNDVYMLVAGNTARGVYRPPQPVKHFININNVAELKQYKMAPDMLTLGGGLSLTETMEIFLKAATRPGFEYCQQLWKHFNLIAHLPVRNMGTLAGNINLKKMYPAFQSDVFILLETMNAKVIVYSSASAQKTVPLMEYIKDKTTKTVMAAILLKAYPKISTVFMSYKIMPRAQNAHAYVNAGFLLDMNLQSGIVNFARICFGGISPEYVHAWSLESILFGQNLFDKRTVSRSFSELYRTLQPDSSLPEPSPEYRRTLACGLFYKFLLSIAPAYAVRPEYRKGGELLIRPLSSGTQTFGTNENSYPVTKAVEKIEALMQCTGEATYTNDIHTSSNSVFCAFVTATKCNVRIERIDASEALRQPGVIAFYSAKDIPGKNTIVDKTFLFNAQEEEFLCTGDVKYFGQPLAVIAALTSDIANLASKLVKVMYSRSVQEVLPTIEDVLNANRMERSHVIVESKIKCLELSMTDSVKGIFIMGGQYHYTMEPHTALVVPYEQGYEVWSTTQWMDQTQCVIAGMLQIRANDVQIKVPRLGGGFGCKITRSNAAALAAALVAFKLGRPARFVQRMESMMSSIGKRWACRSDYEFRIKPTGEVIEIKNNFIEDAGYTLNENPIVFFTLPALKNCYNLTDNNLKANGTAMLTDAPSNTWCRAPGSLEGIAMIENIMEHIAFEANIDPVAVRMANIRAGSKMAELLPRFINETEYRRRRTEIDKFNSENCWVKYGLGLAIMEFPFIYLGLYSCTIAIYHCDGTVVCTHGGIEMGQGINTKVAQVIAHYLVVPLEKIKIVASDTVSGANNTVTGNSMSSESVCFAARKACEVLIERLKPVRVELNNAPWEKIVQIAYERNINLVVNDSYKLGDMQDYSICGCALTEVVVDILTGTTQIKRVDILQDAGESLSPNIDIGQIEGAFVMGLGYWGTEKIIYDRQTGELVTNRSWFYKTPGAKDIPCDFRIKLLQNSPNPAGFMRSKTTGEPPACLAVSYIFALRYALMSARKDAGCERQWLRLGAPTTPEEIVLSSGTNASKFSLY